jgi:ABC-2 type transport system ATP-binding protein
MNDYALSRNAPPQTSGSQVAIVMEHLTVSYGAKPVLKGLSLQVPIGSIFGFLGANGAGKTTTIKTLLGFRPPNGGSARVLGYDVVRSRVEICARVGYVSEVNSLYEVLNVPQICTFCRDTQRRWNQEVVDGYLKLFELPTNKRIGHFSKGMKAQLALCLALGNAPDLLILDEPTAGLDPVARQVFLNTLVSDVAAKGSTVFFSSHLLSEIEAIADRVAVIRDGKIVLSDELDNLREAQKVLRLTYAERPPAEEIAVLRGLPGVRRLEQEGRNVRLHVEGDVDALTRTIQARACALRDTEAVNASLDDILLEYIRGDAL